MLSSTRSLVTIRAMVLLWLAAAVSVQAQQSAASNDRWLSVDGTPLPFANDDDLLDFLRSADIVSEEELEGGTNRPLKLHLEQGGVEANAIFRLVDVKLRRARLDGKLVADFHDSHIYECAAYQVSSLLGIDNVPPCVRRKIQFTEGTVQLWIENATTEKRRREKDIKPPEQLRWLRQKQTMRLFDALIYNFDRNQGNMLIDPNWKLWFIDHTRSFRKSTAIENLEKIIWCEREIWTNLLALDKKKMVKHLRPYLSSTQINTMIKRREKLVSHIRSRIERMGDGAVLYDESEHSEVSSSDLAQLTSDDDIPDTSSLVEESVEDP